MVLEILIAVVVVSSIGTGFLYCSNATGRGSSELMITLPKRDIRSTALIRSVSLLPVRPVSCVADHETILKKM